MAILSHEQKRFFEEQGYLLVKDAVSVEQLAALREQFATWVQESKSHRAAYGETLDGRARFDLETGHSADKPALRRINAPTDISKSCNLPPLQGPDTSERRLHGDNRD